MLQAMRAFLYHTFGAFGVFVQIGLFVLCPVGALFWLWMATQLGSFIMAFCLFFPLTTPIAIVVGAYSVLFGAPGWVFTLFA